MKNIRNTKIPETQKYKTTQKYQKHKNIKLQKSIQKLYNNTITQ